MCVFAVSDLVKRYRNGTLANDQISLALEPGEVYGLPGGGARGQIEGRGLRHVRA